MVSKQGKQSNQSKDEEELFDSAGYISLETLRGVITFLLENKSTKEPSPKKRAEMLQTAKFIREEILSLHYEEGKRKFHYKLRSPDLEEEGRRHFRKRYLIKLAEDLYKLISKHRKTGTFRKPGHLLDQTLKYSYPPDKGTQLRLFDSLMDNTKDAISKINGVEVTEIVEGIKLSGSETKVIDCLCKLLHESSQTSDPTKDNYYSGNMTYDLVEYGEVKETPAPKLGFTLYELTKEYKGGEDVSGKDVDNVKQILTELNEKHFLLSYVETTKRKDGGRIERKIEDFKKLIHIIKLSETEYNKEDVELSRKEETVILLNPIFRRQIDSKFILYPNDITRRTIIAYGNHNISEATLRLRDYLMREVSNKRYKPEIGLDRLYYQLAEKWMKESRRKKVKEYTDKAIKTVKSLGLLESYEIKANAEGEPKVVFTLNKNWQ